MLQLDVEMVEQDYTMEGIVLKPGGEDPAYEIIRNAVKTREEHLYEIKKFETDVYVKGQIQLRDFPDKFFGSKVDFEDGDTSKKKMIFLSETVANGAQNGFGMASPQIISFYNNIINVGEGLNPRGSTVFQFDKNNPIDAFDNTLSTLYWQNNYMKIYQAKFFKADFTKGLNNGLTLQTSIQYQDRIPLENTTNYSWRSFDNKTFTPNYPAPLQQITAHKAFSLNANLTWRPGARYVEFPDRKINIGSRYPTFNFSFTQGIPSVLGSDVDYSKWAFTMSDNLNLKLGGKINYKLRAAGFAHNTASSVIDMNHVLGNQISSASEYLNSFQLMPYYMFSNTSKFYTEAHIEYHLNGLLTNKIPLFKKLNWFFVVGTNVLYNNDEKAGYYEALVGVENILKVFRIDFVKAFTSNKTSDNFGVKFSFPLFGKNRP
ncbi:unnamed protein product [Rotaria sp. Silwood1]|nr:unnamed protein product [Rotaria sp. Silwood1]